MAFGTFILIPAFVQMGIPIFYSYVFAYAFPMAVLLLMALSAFKVEGNPSQWSAFKQRYQLWPLTRRDWLWICGILIAQAIISIPFSMLESRIIQTGLIPFPLAAQLSLTANEELLAGGWMPLLVSVGLLVINVFAEELWFRGYVYPRQEKVHGPSTWILHWLSWWLVFHFFKWWSLITILPVTGLTVYLYRRTGKTTATLIVHFLGNFFSLGLVALSIMLS
jgi:membrane protease YdiL (CAAX protease family)